MPGRDFLVACTSDSRPATPIPNLPFPTGRRTLALNNSNLGSETAGAKWLNGFARLRRPPP